ncbi:MAG: hypothetical protein VKJ46_00365, partial [Leptolyngbyaceae bacterium]|nr:hypothetical protein [Leptolyngbyaceae bacterium]
GEIMLLRNWIREKTLAFFLELEKALSPEFQALPLGERLQQAGLVEPTDIAKALRDQKQLRGKFGQILALNRVIRPATADYFAQL